MDLLAWSITSDVQSRTTTQTSTAPGTGGLDRYQAFAYDRADRLAGVTDRLGDACTTRAYSFDQRGNRTGLTTATRSLDETGTCAATTGSSSKTWTYDTADCIQQGANTTGGYVYDPLGRQTTIPSADTPASNTGTGGGVGDIHLAYYDSDAAKTITQAGVTTSYTLDPAGRRALETTDTASDADPVTTRVERHYTDGSDNPAYVTATDAEGATSNTWYATSINGDLGSTITGDTQTLSLIDPLGSVATTITTGHDNNDNPTLAIGPTSTWDEYGNPLTTPPDNDDPADTTTNQPAGPIDYGWLGGKQRPTNTSGITLMGARLYNPVTGQFTTTDPIHGGNTTTYTYPQDPINQTDLDGHKGLSWKRWGKKIADSRIGKWVYRNRRAVAHAVLNVVGGALVVAAGALMCTSVPGAGCAIAASIATSIPTMIPAHLAIDRVFKHRTTRAEAIKYVGGSIVNPVRGTYTRMLRIRAWNRIKYLPRRW